MKTIKVEIWAEETVRYRQVIEVPEGEFELIKDEEGMRSPRAEMWIDRANIDEGDGLELLDALKLEDEE